MSSLYDDDFFPRSSLLTRPLKSSHRIARPAVIAKRETPWQSSPPYWIASLRSQLTGWGHCLAETPWQSSAWAGFGRIEGIFGFVCVFQPVVRWGRPAPLGRAGTTCSQEATCNACYTARTLLELLVESALRLVANGFCRTLVSNEPPPFLGGDSPGSAPTGATRCARRGAYLITASSGGFFLPVQPSL